MTSTSIAPSVKTVDIYLDGSDWKVDLFADDGTTQIASAVIGTVPVDANSIVALPLDLRALGKDAAHEIRVFGAAPNTKYDLKVRHAEPISIDFPVALLNVVDGEVLGQQVEKIVSIGSGITRLRLAWG